MTSTEELLKKIGEKVRMTYSKTLPDKRKETEEKLNEILSDDLEKIEKLHDVRHKEVFTIKKPEAKKAETNKNKEAKK